MKTSIVVLTLLFSTLYAQPTQANSGIESAERAEAESVLLAGYPHDYYQQDIHQNSVIRHKKRNPRISPADARRLQKFRHRRIQRRMKLQQYRPYRRSVHRSKRFYRSIPPYPSHCSKLGRHRLSRPFGSSRLYYRGYCDPFIRRTYRTRTQIRVLPPFIMPDSSPLKDGNEDPQQLVKQVEAAIQADATLRDQVTDITLIQAGSTLQYSGSVNHPETLEQLIEIALEMNGIKSVETQNVIVVNP